MVTQDNLVPRAFSIAWGGEKGRKKVVGTRMYTGTSYIGMYRSHPKHFCPPNFGHLESRQTI